MQAVVPVEEQRARVAAGPANTTQLAQAQADAPFTHHDHSLSAATARQLAEAEAQVWLANLLCSLYPPSCSSTLAARGRTITMMLNTMAASTCYHGNSVEVANPWFLVTWTV
jgi:hypothetical protein